MSKKPETLFKEKVFKDLSTLESSWFFKSQEVAQRGIPDVIMCVKGTFVAIELKKDAKAKIDPLQTWTISKIGATGALALVAYPENWKEIFTQIQEI
jgi:hypothetical protein